MKAVCVSIFVLSCVSIIVALLVYAVLSPGEQRWVKAIESGDIQSVRNALRAEGIEYRYSRFHEEWYSNLTPLMYAAQQSDEQMLQTLIELGQDPGARDEFQHLAIHHAARFGNSTALATLSGITHTRGSDDKIIVYLAVQSQDSATLVEALRNTSLKYKQSDFSPLIEAARLGSCEAIELLIESGFDVNAAQPVTGKSPLMYAAENECLCCVKLLINYGASPIASDNYGRRAIDFLPAEKSPEISEILYMLQD